MLDWFDGLPDQTQTAGLAIVTTLGTILLKDVVVWQWRERRRERLDALAVYRVYAEPLAHAASALMWRLLEILEGDARSSYLDSDRPLTQFEQYKRLSTFYRLASLLGWVRALRIELSFVRLGTKGKLLDFEDALSSLEKALADGQHVEMQRLKGLMSVFEIVGPLGNQGCTDTALEIEVEMKRYLHEHKVTAVRSLDDKWALELCTKAVHKLSAACGRQQLQEEQIREKLEDAKEQMDIREAWLYRDWQTAIADIVLKEASASDRSYTVIGFGEFESIALAPSEEQYRCLQRIVSLFDGVSFASPSPLDARPETLRTVCDAVARVVIASEQADRRNCPVDRASLRKAKSRVACDNRGGIDVWWPQVCICIGQKSWCRSQCRTK